MRLAYRGLIAPSDTFYRIAQEMRDELAAGVGPELRWKEHGTMNIPMSKSMTREEFGALADRPYNRFAVFHDRGTYHIGDAAIQMLEPITDSFAERHLVEYALRNYRKRFPRRTLYVLPVIGGIRIEEIPWLRLALQVVGG